MWTADDAARGSYEVARSDDAADEVTLTDEHELPLSPEELAFHDPLDEKNHILHVGDVPASPLSPRWTEFASRLRWWQKPQRSMDHQPEPEKDEDAEETGLLENNWSSRDRLMYAGQTTVSWLIWPLPSYTHRFFGFPQPDEPRRPTDYLDGLRGVASLFVFFDHYLVGLKTDIVQYGFGADGNWSPFQLPFIRTIYSGSAMVAIFFVISGYVLSARCIIAMRAGNQDKVHHALTSMTFRRAMRLFVPSIGSSLLTMSMVFLGILGPQWPKHWTVWHELHNYWTYLHEDLFKLWAWDISFKGWYAPQLWTIPLEFKCSMILFMLLLAVARCTVLVRFAIEGSLLLYLFYVDRWDVATFVAGMTIAEINIIADERRKARDEARAALTEAAGEEALTRPLRKKHPLITFVTQLPLWCVLIFAFYLTGYPGSDPDHTPGYRWLTHFWRDDWDYKFRFFLAQAAILLVFSISFLPLAQKFFTTSIARYLGKISYALYLVHTAMNRTLRFFLWNTFWGIMQYESSEGDDAKFEGGWFLGTIIYVPCVLWAADIFWRMCDIPAVKLAKWVEDKCFVPSPRK